MTTAIRVNYGKKQNAKTWANKFRARVLEPGIVSYEDSNSGKSLLRKETLDAYMHTFVGRPLILARDELKRPTYKHAKVTPTNLEAMAAGYISNVYYDQNDGWWWCEGTVHDEEAKEAIRNVGYVSCAYDVLETGPGGEWHAIPYVDEITAFEGEHLAIVSNPRYEGATIRLNNKNKTPMHPFKWIKKLVSKQNAEDESAKGKEPEQKQNAVEGEIPADATFIVDGKEVSLSTLVDSFHKTNAKENSKEEEIDGTTEIILGEGQRVQLNDLIESYRKLNSSHDEEKKENEKEDEDDSEKKENAEEDEEKKENEKDEKEEKKENSKTSATVYRVNHKPTVLSKARENGVEIEGTPIKTPDTLEARIARGRELYGPKNVTNSVKS